MDHLHPCRALLLVCLAPLTLDGAGQVICALGTGAAAYKSPADARPSTDAMQLAGRVFAAGRTVCGANCPEVALFRNSTAANVMLVADGNRAKIVYAPQFVTALYDRAGDTAITAIFAHEMGHALDDVLGAAWIEKAWTAELRADAWSGCILAKSNLPPADLVKAMDALAHHPSPSHPVWTTRLPALRSGYTHCGGSPPLPK